MSFGNYGSKVYHGPKVYLTRAQTRAMATELPVGDPFGGPAFGEKNDPVSAAVGGSAVIGGLIQADAASSAADAQRQAAQAATGEQQREYDLARSDAAPYRAAGKTALGTLTSGLAPGGQFAGRFSTSDLENDPIYQKALQWATTQGTQAINRAAAAGGGLDSGATLKGIVDYALGSASQFGNDAFNRFNTEKSNLFNRNASVAGIGQTAVGQTTAAGTNAANNISENLIGAGNARAASIVGGANAITGGVNNALNYYTGQQTLDKVLAAGGGYRMPNPYGSGGGSYVPTPYAYGGT